MSYKDPQRYMPINEFLILIQKNVYWFVVRFISNPYGREKHTNNVKYEFID